MKVLVCGGRDYNNYQKVKETLDRIHAQYPITLLIHGDAKGADKLGERWAKEHGVPDKPYPARWNVDGKAAGPIRNQKMLDRELPHGVVAFPGGNGTRDMISRAKKAGITVKNVEE